MHRCAGEECAVCRYVRGEFFVKAQPLYLLAPVIGDDDEAKIRYETPGESGRMLKTADDSVGSAAASLTTTRTGGEMAAVQDPTRRSSHAG